MDQATQQNAALVEQMAAAASSLQSQAQELVQVVAVFKLAGGDTRPAPPLRAVPAAVRPGAPASGKAIRTPARRALAAPSARA
jgi:hypothetical protein